jgi:mRNA interferase MazF
VRFPFSDLSDTKVRPAIVLADAERGDWVLCQVTSQPYTDPTAIEITSSDFTSGSLKKTSYARPGKLFTGNPAIMTKQIGDLKNAKLEEIIRAVISLLEKSL